MPIAAKCLIRTLILTALVLVVLVVRAVQDLANPKLTNRLAFAAAGATPRWFMPIAAGDLIKTLIVLAALVLAVQDLVIPKLTNRLVFAVAGAWQAHAHCSRRSEEQDPDCSNSDHSDSGRLLSA